MRLHCSLVALLALAVAAPGAGDAGRDWPMFGGGVSRNMANAWDRNVPDDWSVEQGKEKNIKWQAQLGNTAYGGPTIAGGQIYVATNNENPRDPKVTGDKGVVMCFREADEKLWRRNDAGHVDSVLPSGTGKESSNTHIRATPWQLLDLLLCLRRQGSDGSRSQQRDNQKAEEAHKRSCSTIVVPMRRCRQLLQHRDLTQSRCPGLGT